MARMFKLLALAAVVMVPVLGVVRPAHADPVPAVWEARQVKFHFPGFTSYYSCDGIRGTVKRVLEALGARDDVKVEGACLGVYGEPQRYHNLIVAFSVPVVAQDKGSPGETFPAEWRQVSLSPGKPRYLERGDCELVEAIRDQVLPLFNPQAVDDHTVCVPNQVNLGQPNLRATVLVPAKAPEAAAK